MIKGENFFKDIWEVLVFI